MKKPTMPFPSHIKVLKVLWEQGDLTASVLSTMLHTVTGWHRNTAYTVINQCVARGYVARSEPHFLCHALLTREQVRAMGRGQFIDALYDGDAKALLMDLVKELE